MALLPKNIWIQKWSLVNPHETCRDKRTFEYVRKQKGQIKPVNLFVVVFFLFVETVSFQKGSHEHLNNLGGENATQGLLKLLPGRTSSAFEVSQVMLLVPKVIFSAEKGSRCFG